jgi:predicted dehydrogenase
MQTINWGIIGCGDVTEVKSGPAFNKVNHSSLVAVMRRNGEKAKDYAQRHGVPKWYADANSLINDPDVNAIYVATPPSSHEEYAIAAMQAGKPVYVEKPMSTDAASGIRMTKMSEKTKAKLVVAHYRRGQPMFNGIKKLILEKAIGDIRFAQINIWKKLLSRDEMAVPMTAWRIDPAIAGGGLFHDLATHQLDMMYYFFGEIDKLSGVSTNQAKLYGADDIVTGSILYKSGVVFTGTWCFTVDETMVRDTCEIIGSEGKISFTFFEQDPVLLTRNNKTETITFDKLQHVQQPMIEKVVQYFRGEGPNPDTGEEGVRVMQMLEEFTGT